MKRLLLTLSILFTIRLFSQTPIPNGGMETWTNVGASNEEPTEWNSNKTGGGFANLAPQTCFRESGAGNVRSGTYSARIRTTSYFGTPVNGVMTLGRVQAPSTTPSEGYNETILGDANFSEATTSVPDSIVFWAKYVPISTDLTDSARVSFIIHDNYSLNDPQEASGVHVRAKAVRNFRTGGVYVRIALPLQTVNAGVSPTYMLCTFTSSKTPGVGTTGTILYIDDVMLVYNPPTITTGTISPLIYYVSASQSASISVPYSITGAFTAGNNFTAQLSNSAGSFASPTTIGAVASTSGGTIAATIPAGTTSGTGYRVRVIGSTPSITGTPNVSNIEIVLASNSIAPSATQTIQTNTNGTTLNVTETAGLLSREWKYATVSGGPYVSFAPIENGTSYTPNFTTAGTYYVVCETTYPNGIVVTSNQVQINVVGNNIAPTGSQSILVGVNGTTLNVTETPTGSSREWKFATTPGGPYSSFIPVQTGTSYTPNFASAGTYYVVCQSTISSITCTSNEVQINVGSLTLTTGTIAGSPYLFSPNAPDALVSVPYTVSGSLNPGNTFTAQLSDASGSFASPTTIGSISATTSGTISATIPHTTPEGTGYRIRVVSSSPAILGSDNGVDLVIDQFDNSVSPSTPQTIMYGVNGTAISAAESQTSTRIWKFATVSGGPYSIFSPSETGVSYTPNFATPGTYYVVAVSRNIHNDTVISNEVEINVTNGTTLTTASVGSTTYYLSPNAVVGDNVTFTSDIIFNSGNIFTAEISDPFGSFASPTTIGTVVSSTISPVTVSIPNSLSNGTGYRIRINSSSPAAVGTPNPIDLSVVQFENNAAPADTQNLLVGVNGTLITVNATHPTGVTQEWKYKAGLAGVVTSFSPLETGTTYTPNFSSVNAFYVKCISVNMWNDTVETDNVVIITSLSNIEDENGGNIEIQWMNDNLNINLLQSTLQNPTVDIINTSGQVIYTQLLNANSNNSIALNLVNGMYICRVVDNNKAYHYKFIKR